MKKVLGMVICGALALTLFIAGCAQVGATDDSEQTGGATVGGWTVYDQATASITDEEKAIFEAALEGLLGVDYEPVAVIATQVVAGTNRAYLCKGTTVTAEPSTNWYVITVYENLSGETELLAINQIDIEAPLTVDEGPDANLVGGWSVVEAAGIELLPAEAAEALEAATGETVGMEYNPIAVLATQVVNGTNYLILCEGAAVTAEPVPALYLVQVNAASDGSAELLNVAQLDLITYVTRAE